ncbi:hypothetical protein [Streptomyces sp. NPDC048155]|uniref:hypothetical protein n=1 Tax=Streptomyces sp. NPDC048155 TaxID=3154818 RepID=UPI0033FA4269
MVFVVALSLMAGFFGSAHHDLIAVLLTVMVTTVGIVGLWLLPPALSPHLLDALRPKQAHTEPS